MILSMYNVNLSPQWQSSSPRCSARPETGEVTKGEAMGGANSLPQQTSLCGLSGLP